MESPNAEMAEYWSSTTGPAWVAAQETMDRMLRPLGEAAMARLALTPDSRVVDVGCGCGDTTVALARQAARVLGVDVSESMLARARQNVAEAGVGDRVELRLEDAQIADLGAGADAVFSRFGVMFFADPVVAFANLRRAMRPGARLSFVCWQEQARNVWLTAPRRAASPLIEVSAAAEPGEPGPFGLADCDATATVLDEAGFTDVNIDSLESPLHLGDSLEAVVDKFMVVGSVGNAVRRLDPSDDVRAALRDALRAAFGEFVDGDGVRVPSAAWLVAARA